MAERRSACEAPRRVRSTMLAEPNQLARYWCSCSRIATFRRAEPGL